jgi:hypothetical protein
METQQAQKFDVDELASRASKIMERLKTGPWPSHVAELEKTKYPPAAYAAGLVARKTAWAAPFCWEARPAIPAVAPALRASHPVGARHPAGV